MLLQTIYTCLIYLILTVIPRGRSYHCSLLTDKRTEGPRQGRDSPRITMLMRQPGFEPSFLGSGNQALVPCGVASQAKVGAVSPQPQIHFGVTGNLSSPQWRLNCSLPLPFCLGHSPPRSPFLSRPNCFLPSVSCCHDCLGPGERERRYPSSTHRALKDSACPAISQAREKGPLSTALHSLKPQGGWTLPSL